MGEHEHHAGTAGLAVVLSGGGARAAYQVGVLAALAEMRPELEVPILTGVSAGAINTLYLAAHPGPFADAVDGLRREWSRLTPEQVYAVRPSRLGRALLRWAAQRLRRRAPTAAVHGLMDLEPLRRFVERCMAIDGIGANVARGRLRAAAVTATCYDTGETVTFVQGAEDVPSWHRSMRRSVRTTLTIDHLLASAAIPIVFPAIGLPDGAFYGDGSVRQVAPLAPAIHLGARRVLAVAMRTADPVGAGAEQRLQYPAAAEVLGLLLHSIFLDSLDADAERLERINQLIRRVPHERRAESALRWVDLLVLRPSRDLGALARGVDLALPRLLRMALNGIGGQQVRAADFLSYLAFDPRFTGVIMELGYDDGRRQAAELEAFLDRSEAETKGRSVGS